MHWVRTALLAVLLPLLASSAFAQVWVPGNTPPNQPAPQAQTVPAQAPAESQPADTTPVAMPVKDDDSRLSPETRLVLIRYVSGEFAKAKISLPGGKKGFHVQVGQPLNPEATNLNSWFARVKDRPSAKA